MLNTLFDIHRLSNLGQKKSISKKYEPKKWVPLSSSYISFLIFKDCLIAYIGKYNPLYEQHFIWGYTLKCFFVLKFRFHCYFHNKLQIFAKLTHAHLPVSFSFMPLLLCVGKWVSIQKLLDNSPIISSANFSNICCTLIFTINQLYFATLWLKPHVLNITLHRETYNKRQ